MRSRIFASLSRASDSDRPSRARSRMWRTCVCCTPVEAAFARFSAMRTMWKPFGLLMRSLTSPGCMRFSTSRKMLGSRPEARQPRSPPCSASGASEYCAATLAKLAPPRSCVSASTARRRRTSICSGVACAGTVTRMWFKWYSVSPLASRASRVSSVSTSASVTTTELSTSCSRSRAMVISLRMSSRKRGYLMPSRSRAARKSADERPFSCAMRSIVLSSVGSSTFTPLSLASCSCTRSLIMRSRIWRASASDGGSSPPWRWSWRTTRPTRSFRSFCVITSSFTTATMRSTGTMRDGVEARLVSMRPTGGGLGDCAKAGRAAASSAAAMKRRGDAWIMEESRPNGGTRRCSAGASPAD